MKAALAFTWDMACRRIYRSALLSAWWAAVACCVFLWPDSDVAAHLETRYAYGRSFAALVARVFALCCSSETHAVSLTTSAVCLSNNHSSRRVLKTIAADVAGSNYRADLKDAALRRASAVLRSQKSVKAAA